MAGHPGHPRLAARSVKDADVRDKPGNDELDGIASAKTLDERQYADPGGDYSAQAHGQAQRLGLHRRL
jgi:hypothetical protein